MELLIIYIIMGLVMLSNVYTRVNTERYRKVTIAIVTIVFFTFWPLFYIWSLYYALKKQKPSERFFTALSICCFLYVLINGVMTMI